MDEKSIKSHSFENLYTYFCGTHDEHTKSPRYWGGRDEIDCDIDGLLEELRIAHEPNEWRLFIDASKLSLKAVLLNNGNELSTIPLALAVSMKETYQNLKELSEMISYTGRSVIRTANVFFRTLPTWENGTRAIGPRQCWLTTVECLSEVLLTSSTSDRPKEIEIRLRYS
ncbi:hypothetical protein AVEN_104676-1 [Araneus ventricosus]|uniref:Uncharacterized protein n=1 Tax=Araneus ventricosus TaxID=182803 RepID=A0A4Y2BCH2_ARAVE|nr:hypothetical protein AVEN_104676-1 [Araneus ventricosus]